MYLLYLELDQHKCTLLITEICDCGIRRVSADRMERLQAAAHTMKHFAQLEYVHYVCGMCMHRICTL